jgi:hypothetical protein
MQQTKAEVPLEIRLLRDSVKQNRVLRQRLAVNSDCLQDAYDAIVATDEAARQYLRKFERPQITEDPPPT